MLLRLVLMPVMVDKLAMRLLLVLMLEIQAKDSLLLLLALVPDLIPNLQIPLLLEI